MALTNGLKGPPSVLQSTVGGQIGSIRQTENGAIGAPQRSPA